MVEPGRGVKSPPKWSKVDIKRMCQAIDNWSAWYKPIQPFWADLEKDAAWRAGVRATIAKPGGIVGIVCCWERCLAHAARCRVVQYARTALHAEQYPDRYGIDAVERFTGLARKSHREAEEREAFCVRVRTGELPPSVVAYVPTRVGV